MSGVSPSLPWNVTSVSDLFLTSFALQLSLMDDGGNNRDDLTLPKGTEEAEKLAKTIQEEFDGGKEVYVTVLKVGFQDIVYMSLSLPDLFKASSI